MRQIERQGYSAIDNASKNTYLYHVGFQNITRKTAQFSPLLFGKKLASKQYTVGFLHPISKTNRYANGPFEFASGAQITLMVHECP